MTTRPDDDIAIGEEELLEVRRRRLLPLIILGVLVAVTGVIVKIATTHSGSGHGSAPDSGSVLKQAPPIPSTSVPQSAPQPLVPGFVVSADYHAGQITYVASMQSTSAATLTLAGPVQVRTQSGAAIRVTYAGLLVPAAARALRPPSGNPPPLVKVAPHQLVDLVLVIPVNCSAASTRLAERATGGPTILIWFTDQAPLTLAFDEALGGYAGLLKSECAG